DQQVGVGHLGCVEVRGEGVLVDLDASCDGAVGRVDNLGAAAVVEGNPEIQAAVALRLTLQRGHPLPQPYRRSVPTADEARPNSLTHEIGELALDRLGEDLHQQL